MVDKIKASGIGDKILELYDMGYSCDKVAVMTGNVVTGRSILRFVEKHGRKTWDTRRDVVCEYCKKEFKKIRSLFLKSRKHYCTHKCFSENIKNPKYIRSVYGMRMARKSVRDCGYYLIDGEVVHHKDFDTTNNDPNNLMVFAGHGDHTRWHRCEGVESGVKPLWDGSSGICK